MMDTTVRRQVQAVGSIVDVFSDQKWPTELERKLGAWSVGDGGLCIGLQLEQHILAADKLLVLAVLVRLNLDVLMRVVQLLTKQFWKILTARCKLC